MKWLNYHHLLYFREIAKAGSIAKASDKLLVGQPALSHQLKQLEESLGVLLFERKHRSLNLTEAGKRALLYAEEIFNKGEEFLDAFDSKVVSGNRYRIGAIGGIPKTLVANLVQFALEIEKNGHVSTFEGENEDLIQKLEKHELDIVLTNQLVESYVELENHLIGESSVSVYGHESFKSLSKDFPQSLNGAPMVMQTMHSKLRSDIDTELEGMHIRYELKAQCQDYAVKKLLASKGLGLVFLPDFVGKEFVRSFKMVKIGTFEKVSEKYWLITSNKVVKNALTSRILAEFQGL